MNPLKILIIDKNSNDQVKYQCYLNKAFSSVEVITVNTCSQGKECLAINQIDCILLDYNLPDTNCIKFLSSVELSLPVIMLIEQDNDIIAADSLKSGAADYLIKSEIASGMLRQAILNAIKKFKLARQVSEQEQKIKYIAYHDYLTGLPNRLYLDQLACELLTKASAGKTEFAIIMTDLNGFKHINDSLGHSVGDIILQKIAERFQRILPKPYGMGRLGGDEFIFLVEDELQETIENLIVQLQEPFLIGNHLLTISISQGIAIYPQDGQTVAELMKNSDIAMYRAKLSGKNQFKFYNDTNYFPINDDLLLESAINQAIVKNEFYLLYQPVIDIDSNQLYSVEAVLRWNNNQFMHIPLDKIIAICEDSRLILAIGDWVTKKVLQQYKLWKQQYPEFKIKLSINLSPLQLENPHWFTQTAALLAELEVPPSQIIFELTETAIVTNCEKAQQQIIALCNLGCNIYIDDYGTGFSSLNLVRDLPISGLKVDKSFINHVTTNPKHLIIVNSIIEMAAKLGITLIVEGVESKEQLDLLHTHNNVKVQGFYFQRPMTPEQIIENYFSI